MSNMTPTRGLRVVAMVAISMIAGLVVSPAPRMAAQSLPPAKALPGIGEQLPGLSSRYWDNVLRDGGRLPENERLVVVATDGRMLDMIDGSEASVDIPIRFDAGLSDGSLQVVLAHNHPMNTSLSGADVALLARRGVERVIALGNDGSLYEAATGSRSNAADALPAMYPVIEARVLERIPVEAIHAGVPTTAGFDNASHLIASVLDRAGLIRYRSRMSVSRASIYVDQQTWLSRVIEIESRRLVDDLDRRR